MIGVLTPTQALAYLRELSPAVTGARIFDRAGVTLACSGGPAQGEPSVVRVRDGERELAAAIGAGAVVDLVRADGALALAAVRIQC